MKTLSTIIATLLPLTFSAAVITSISVTGDTQEGGTPLAGNLSVSAPPYPLDISTGAGLLINPSIPGFGLHSHIFDSANIPHNAIITFRFSSPAVVDSLRVVEHANGITRVEGFVGESLSSMTSIGNIFGPLGDVTGSGVFTDRSSYLFDFQNTTPGLYYQFVITKTSLVNGYATYNINPLDPSGQPFGPAVAPEPVRLDFIPPFTNGQFRLRLSGASGTDYTIQTATNLTVTDSDWVNLATSNSATGTFDFVDTQATNRAQFYRAVSQ